VLSFATQLFLHYRHQAWQSFDFGITILNEEMLEEMRLFFADKNLDLNEKINWTPQLITGLQSEIIAEFIDETFDAHLKKLGLLRIESLYDSVKLYESATIKKINFCFKELRKDNWGYRPFEFHTADKIHWGMGYSGVMGINTHYFVGAVFPEISREELANNASKYRKITREVYKSLERSASDLYMRPKQRLLQLLDKNNAWAYVYLLRQDSLLWCSNNVDKSKLYLPNNLLESEVFSFVKDQNENIYRQYSQLYDKYPDNAYRIDVAVPCDYLQKSILLYGLFVGLGALFIILVTAFGSHSLRKRVLKPIKKAINTVNEFSTKDIDKRIPVHEVDKDTARLIETFNHLLDRLENAFKQQKAFIADTSHELRTPLSILTFDIAEALKKTPEDSPAMEHLHEANREIRHIARIVNNLQWLAKNDAGQLFVDKKKIRMDEVLMETLSRCHRYAIKNKVKLDIGTTDVVEVFGDEKLLVHAYSNLVNNAIKYSKRGVVKLSLVQHNSTVRLQVEDNGIGIAKRDLEKIFDRFYRVDSSRSRETGGAGLGLAIAKQIAEIHDGTIRVESVLGKGSVFALELPHNNKF